MEDKWAIFYHNKTILFVRSWLREVFVLAKIKEKDNFIEVYEMQGKFTSENETDKQTELYFDFLIRNLVYGIVYPVPITEEQSKNPEDALGWSFSNFGSICLVATSYSIPNKVMDIPLRSISLFHIAIAKGDYDTVVKYIKN